MEINLQYDAAFWASLPPAVRALANQQLSQNARTELVQELKAQYGEYMVNAIEEEDWEPWEFAMISAMDGYNNGVPNLTQIPIGNAGQYAKPGLPPEPDQLGPYPAPPAPMPKGWVSTPSQAELDALVAPGANVTALLAKLYPPFVAPK